MSQQVGVVGVPESPTFKTKMSQYRKQALEKAIVMIASDALGDVSDATLVFNPAIPVITTTKIGAGDLYVGVKFKGNAGTYKQYAKAYAQVGTDFATDVVLSGQTWKKLAAAKSIAIDPSTDMVVGTIDATFYISQFPITEITVDGIADLSFGGPAQFLVQEVTVQA